MLEWLNLGRVDCALVYNATASAHVDLQPLVEDTLYLVAPAGGALAGRTASAAVASSAAASSAAASSAAARSAAARSAAVTLEELADLPLIMPSRPHAMRMAVENALAGVNRKVRIAYEIECIPALIDLVRQGHGFGVLPRNAVRLSHWADEVTITPVGDPPLHALLSIATSSQRPLGSLLRKAIDLIRDIVRREIHSHPIVHAAVSGTEFA
jgi:LysR family nitrogen assimilation transcriptional regulator